MYRESMSTGTSSLLLVVLRGCGPRPTIMVRAAGPDAMTPDTTQTFPTPTPPPFSTSTVPVLYRYISVRVYIRYCRNYTRGPARVCVQAGLSHLVSRRRSAFDLQPAVIGTMTMTRTDTPPAKSKHRVLDLKALLGTVVSSTVELISRGTNERHTIPEWSTTPAGKKMRTYQLLSSSTGSLLI